MSGQLDFSGVELVALDAVGTLIHTAQPVAASYTEIAARHGVVLNQDDVSRRFAEAISLHTIDHDFESLALATNEAIERAWWRNFIAQVLAIDSEDAQLIFDDLWDYFARPESWRLYGDAMALIEFLHASRVPWVIASNFDARLHQVCRNDPYLMQAKAVFVSSEVQWRKPSVHFFRHLAAELKCPPSSILMIGDDLIADYQAAKFASWQAIRIKRNGEAAAGELTTLSDIPMRLQQY